MKKTINYLDLFSGLGAFAKGLLDAGFKFKNHYFSEIDKYAIANYKYNFKNAHYVGQIEKVKDTEIQKPDIVTFGSPCQDISHAGKRKGIFGKRSKLFFEAVKIIDRFRPKVFVFENVKALLFNNKGKDFEVVLRAIANLGLYECQWQLINTAWLLPQNRERLFLVGSLAGESVQGIFPLLGHYEKNQKRTSRIKVIGRYGNYNQNTVFSSKGCAPTLLSGNGRPEGYVKAGRKIRQLTPLECERLQGLPDDWTKFGEFETGIKELSSHQRYILLGNAITAEIMRLIGKKIIKEFNAGLQGIKKANKMNDTKTNINEIEIHYKQKIIGEYGSIQDSDDAADIVRSIIGEDKMDVREQVIILYFNAKNTLIGYHLHSIGTITSSPVDNKIILSIAVKTLASSIIIAHNHPSGNLEPSENDKKMTRKLKEASKVHHIRLLDSIIVTSKSCYSFHNDGLLGTEDSYPIIETKTDSGPELNEDAVIHINNLKKYLKDRK